MEDEKDNKENADDSEAQGGEGDTGQAQGEGGEQEGATQAPSQISALEALQTPEGIELVSRQVDTLLADREAARQADENLRAWQERPDEEVGKQVKEQVARQRDMAALMPEAQRAYYEGVVSDLVRTMPELAELTVEEKQAVLSRNLRSDAEVLHVLTNIVAEKRAAKVTDQRIQEALQAREQGQANEEIAKGNEQQVPATGGGAPALGASPETTDPSKLLSEHYAETPIPE